MRWTMTEETGLTTRLTRGRLKKEEVEEEKGKLVIQGKTGEGEGSSMGKSESGNFLCFF